jgi:cyclohexanone monooxygenase
MTSPAATETFDATFDAVVVGAGFGGMYMLLKLRENGYSARVYETGDDVGGTWYWNRYPGCRCDVESMQYSYSFSDELQQEWDWSERYAPQPEILAYARHVADRFDLRRDIEFETRIDHAVFDAETNRWTIETDTGKRISARYFITAVGCLSTANMPDFKDRDKFRGNLYHTGQWPHEGVDFTRRRVAVIGTGSSGIQSIPLIAKDASRLYVFQRTPNFVVPARNRPLDPAERDAVKANYTELRSLGRSRPTGFYFDYNSFSALDVDASERERLYEEFWDNGGLPFLGVFNDLLINAEPNETAAEFVRDKIRQIVKDPETAELLAPRDIIGCKRLCADTGYFETFNLPHVTLVDISKTPISRFTEDGLMVGTTGYQVDDIVCATGFDAMTGALLKIDIRGVDGRTLADKWVHGPRSYLGLGIKDFPNMFTITGPGSPSVFANMILCVEQHSDWIVACMNHMRANNLTRIEATLAAEDAWVEHNREIGEGSLRSQCKSWYLGSNIPGKPKVFSPYIGGFPIYTDKLAETVSEDYRGFALSS